MNKNIYKFNRNNLLDKIKDNSIVILFAGKAIQKTGDQTYPFTPNRNFYYLTGVKEEEHILVMSKIKEITDVDEVKFKSQFNSDIHKMITMKDEINLYLDLERMSADTEGTISHKFAKEMMSKYPQIRVNNIYSKIGELRLKKSPQEVEKIKKAIEITKSGI